MVLPNLLETGGKIGFGNDLGDAPKTKRRLPAEAGGLNNILAQAEGAVADVRTPAVGTPNGQTPVERVLEGATEAPEGTPSPNYRQNSRLKFRANYRQACLSPSNRKCLPWTPVEKALDDGIY